MHPNQVHKQPIEAKYVKYDQKMLTSRKKMKNAKKGKEGKKMAESIGRDSINVTLKVSSFIIRKKIKRKAPTTYQSTA